MKLEIAEFTSPVGRLSLAVHEERLVALCFEGLWVDRARRIEQRFGELHCRRAKDPAGVRSALERYFDGDLGALDGIEVETWGTDFQQRVWKALRRIPVGQTRSYLELARSVGAPEAVRAVGAANGANPVGIVVPCHRVIGSNGKLTGFAGGLENKRWLLDHESAQLAMTA